jgi:uncharacterized protein
MRVIKQSNYRVMPWKNGGGTTTEIHVSPEGVSGFDWRVSIAAVNVDGPFSMFKGYNRHIVVLGGKGMALDVADRGVFDLVPFQPFSFSGDAKVTGLLTRGTVTDFNLMVHRDFGEGKLRVQECAEPYAVGSAQSQYLVHQLGADSYVLEPGENFVFPANATLVICEVIPRWRPEPAA